MHDSSRFLPLKFTMTMETSGFILRWSAFLAYTTKTLDCPSRHAAGTPNRATTLVNNTVGSRSRHFCLRATCSPRYGPTACLPDKHLLDG
jgi:hypothetical protein